MVHRGTAYLTVNTKFDRYTTSTVTCTNYWQIKPSLHKRDLPTRKINDIDTFCVNVCIIALSGTLRYPQSIQSTHHDFRMTVIVIQIVTGSPGLINLSL